MKLLRKAAAAIALAAAMVAAPASAEAATGATATPPAVTALGPVVHYTHAAASLAVGSDLARPNSGCQANIWSRIDSSQYVFIWDGHTYFRDGPGGTMTVSVSVNSSISATITAGAKISVNELVADAEVTVSASITTSVGITVGHTYSRNITSGKYGNAQYGTWGYRLTWSQWERHNDCSLTELASGGGTAPTPAVGWQYWEN
jgi:hypothetical protein